MTGVDVWPNVSLTRAELRSKVSYSTGTNTNSDGKRKLKITISIRD